MALRNIAKKVAKKVKKPKSIYDMTPSARKAAMSRMRANIKAAEDEFVKAGGRLSTSTSSTKTFNKSRDFWDRYFSGSIGQRGGSVYNHKGMKVPGVYQDGGALPKAALGGGLKALAKKAGKFFSKKKGNPNVIDGKDLSKLKFKGVNRHGKTVRKTGVNSSAERDIIDSMGNKWSYKGSTVEAMNKMRIKQGLPPDNRWKMYMGHPKNSSKWV